MLRQAIATSSRALRSNPRSPYTPSPLFRSRPTIPCQTPITSLRTAALAGSRWYSDATTSTSTNTATTEPAAADAAATETKSDAPAERGKSDNGAGSQNANGVEVELKKKLETKEREAIDWKDKYIRSVADFRNLQTRTQRDMKAARDFAIQNFAKDLVDSVDNLDRALAMGKEKLEGSGSQQAETTAETSTDASKEQNEDLAAFYEGVKMTEALMLQTLAKHGMERFDPQGDKFNPNEHEATFMTPMPDKVDGSVFHVQQKGFKLNGRILRAAKVGVVKNS